MKNFVAIYDTPKIENCKYSFKAKSQKEAEAFADRFFAVPVKQVLETDEFANPINNG